MSATSPLAIIVYVILAILLITTILRRFTMEKLIASILRTPPRNITRTVKSHRTIVKMWKILIMSFCVLIPLLVYLHFGPENREGVLLFVAWILAIMFIKALEDIRYSKTVIARLESEIPTVRHIDTASEKAFEARARKWRTIGVVIALACMVAVLLAFYVTMGGPWWFYLIVSIIMILAVAWRFWLAHRQE